MAAARKKTKRSLKIKPKTSGSRMVLGDLEADIMDYMWQHSPATVREVKEHLAGKRKLAYTTVMTVMSRLVDKGMLSHEERGRSYLYSPTQTFEEFRTRTMDSIFNGLISGFGEPVLSHFVESLGSEDAEKLDELSRLIEQKKKEREERSTTPP